MSIIWYNIFLKYQGGLNIQKIAVINKMKKSLEHRVTDVIASSRLVDSAVCLVLSKNEPGAQLKRILELVFNIYPSFFDD